MARELLVFWYSSGFGECESLWDDGRDTGVGGLNWERILGVEALFLEPYAPSVVCVHL